MTRAENIDKIVESFQVIAVAFVPLAVAWITLQLYMIKLQIDIIREQKRDREDRRKRQTQADTNTARIDKLEAGK